MMVTTTSTPSTFVPSRLLASPLLVFAVHFSGTLELVSSHCGYLYDRDSGQFYWCEGHSELLGVSVCPWSWLPCGVRLCALSDPLRWVFLGSVGILPALHLCHPLFSAFNGPYFFGFMDCPQLSFCSSGHTYA